MLDHVTLTLLQSLPRGVTLGPAIRAEDGMAVAISTLGDTHWSPASQRYVAHTS
jgi:hypothetical protein